MSFRAAAAAKRRLPGLSSRAGGLSQYTKSTTPSSTAVAAAAKKARPVDDTEDEEDDGFHGYGYDDDGDGYGYDSEEEERMLSRKHGEAQDADDVPKATSSSSTKQQKPQNGPASKRQKTDEEIAAEYNHGKQKSKTRKPRITLNETHLLQPQGLTAIYTQFPEQFHKVQYKRTPSDMAKFGRQLRLAYQQWANQLIPGGMPLEELLWKVRTMNGKTNVKQFLTSMRHEIRNRKVERIYGLEKAEQLLAQLEEGMMMETNYLEAQADDNDVNNNDERPVEEETGAVATGAAASGKSMSKNNNEEEEEEEDEFADMDAIWQEEAFDMDPNDFVPTSSLKSTTSGKGAGTAAATATAKITTDKNNGSDDDYDMEAAFEEDPDDFVPSESLTTAAAASKASRASNPVTPTPGKPNHRRIVDDDDDDSSDEEEVEFENNDDDDDVIAAGSSTAKSPLEATAKNPSSTKIGSSRRAIMDDSSDDDDDHDDDELEISKKDTESTPVTKHVVTEEKNEEIIEEDSDTSEQELEFDSKPPVTATIKSRIDKKYESPETAAPPKDLVEKENSSHIRKNDRPSRDMKADDSSDEEEAEFETQFSGKQSNSCHESVIETPLADAATQETTTSETPIVLATQQGSATQGPEDSTLLANQLTTTQPEFSARMTHASETSTVLDSQWQTQETPTMDHSPDLKVMEPEDHAASKDQD